MIYLQYYLLFGFVLQMHILHIVNLIATEYLDLKIADVQVIQEKNTREPTSCNLTLSACIPLEAQCRSGGILSLPGTGCL